MKTKSYWPQPTSVKWNLGIFLAAALFFSCSTNIFSQVNNKNVGPNEIVYSSSSITGDVSSVTKVKPEDKKFTGEKKELLDQLEAARLSNNTAEKLRIENRLHDMEGSGNVTLREDPNAAGGFAGNIPMGQGDYSSSQIFSSSLFSSAIQTQPSNFPNPGRIWVACTKFVSAASDTLKLFYSDNGGQSWNLGYFFYYVNTDFDFRAGELDIELCYDGTAVWIYGVSGYMTNPDGRNFCNMFRFNTSTSSYNVYNIVWPGFATTTNRYYNPRIASDNSFYTNNTYIYLLAAFDSTYSGTMHYMTTKYAHLESPFAVSNIINYSMPNGAHFYWSTIGITAPGYIWPDIAYCRTSGGSDRVMTVYSNPKFVGNFYMAWSDDYGSTLAGSSTITEGQSNYGVRLAFNGGASNYNGMLAYVRYFSGTDWDPYYRSTTDAGANWTSGFINSSDNRCRSVDVQAVRGGNNLFKCAYTQDSANAPYGYYLGGTPGNFPSYGMRVTQSGVDTSFTRIRAGYKNGGGDDCLAIYSYGNGNSVYSSSLCLTTTGITQNNNQAPSEFSLAQNYPNPFNPVTNINFSIPKSSFVKLTVYDAAGKVIAELVNSQLSAGSYNYDFSAAELASGIYFYKLEADGFTDVKKMMLIK